ncbi:MAG: hypothetical protein ABJN04_06935 [Hyphomicrobiales bacterium]
MFGKKAIAISEETRAEAESADAAHASNKSDNKSAKKIEAVLIVYGRDDKGKAHASGFDKDNRQAAIKAAHLMGFKALAVEQPVIKDIAEGLPQGRLFDSGKAFVPFVKEGVCLALEGHAKQFPRDIRKLSESQIADLDQVEDLAPADNDKNIKASAPANSDNDQPAKSEPADDWMDIKVGTTVLAIDDPDDGWWEAKVTHAHKSGIGTNITTMLSLQWVAFPDEPSFVRRSNEVAYFPTGYGQVAPSDLQETGDAS